MPHANDDVDTRNAFTCWCLGQLRNTHGISGNVYEFFCGFKIKVIMFRSIGVEVRSRCVHSDLTEKSLSGEVMQYVIDCG